MFRPDPFSEPLLCPKVAQARLAEAERDPSVLVPGEEVSARIRKIVGL